MMRDRREDYYHERIKSNGAAYAGFDAASIETLLSLFYTEDIVHQACARGLLPFGLSKSSLNVLMLLRHGPDEGMQLHDLGDLLLVSRANITGLIDHLEQRDFVTRAVDPNDRRARFARITPKGVELLNEFIPLHYKNVKSMLRGLSGQEKSDLLALLERTRQSVAAHTKDLDRASAAEQEVANA